MQTSHAVADFIFEHPQIAKEWKDTSNYIVTLAAKDQLQLQNLILKLQEKGISYTAFREPDIDNQITAVAIQPSESTRKLCSSYPLALKEFNNNLINKHNRKESSYAN